MKGLAVLSLVAAASAVTVSVSPSGGITASPLQYGLMFEDINHSGDGGIYAELIQNRAFQSDNLTKASLYPWTGVGGATLTMDATSPLSSALPTSVAVQGPAHKTIGISNPGYWGIEVKPQPYKGSFYSKGKHLGIFTARLVSNTTGQTLATATIPSASQEDSWTHHNFELHPVTSASDVNNFFELLFTPESSSAVMNFNLISLFPPTYNNRENGMRVDLMTALKGLNPSFLRMPGGNNLEGGSPGNWWNWTETIGPLSQRPGRTGTWGYLNTNGLGLVEYLEWCSDLEMEPILAVWDGEYLDGDITSQADLQPYVDYAMEELEFCMGDASTTWGRKRIELGYPEPFPINYVEVGNEDNLNGGLASYNAYRFEMFYNAINAKYPHIEVIASTTAWTDQAGTSAGDDHEYNTPDINAGEFHRFDDVSTTNKWLVGEYASVQANLATNQGTVWGLPFEPFPWWIGSVAEAIFELGGERNTDKIIGMSYAPLMMNLNSHEWNPDMIAYSADSSQTTLSTSYRQIQLLSNNRMTSVLPVNNSADYGPGYWVAGVNAHSNTYVFKAAVYNTTAAAAEPFTVAFPDRGEGSIAQLTVLTADDPYAMNMPGRPEVVRTATTEIRASHEGFSFELPQWSVAVLTTGGGGGSGRGA